MPGKKCFADGCSRQIKSWQHFCEYHYAQLSDEIKDGLRGDKWFSFLMPGRKLIAGKERTKELHGEKSSLPYKD